MELESLTVSALLPATPERIYQAWLDAAEHSAFTGGAATVEPGIGGRHTAWDGYITGKTVELIPGRRIVQSWRTTEFAGDDPDSTITVELKPAKTGTQLTLTHSGVPDGQTSFENVLQTKETSCKRSEMSRNEMMYLVMLSERLRHTERIRDADEARTQPFHGRTQKALTLQNRTLYATVIEKHDI